MTKPTPDSRRIEYRPLADLRPDPRNPKSHALDVIDESIGRFGYVEPVVIDERTGFIISGHGRTKTLQEMHSRGETLPEGLQVSSDGDWLAPVVVGWASRSDTEASAALIALNRTTELGGWVDDALLELLADLGNVEDGFAGVGFDESDVEALQHLANEVGSRPLTFLDDLKNEVGGVSETDLLIPVTLQLPAHLANDLADWLGDSPARHAEAAAIVLKAGSQ